MSSEEKRLNTVQAGRLIGRSRIRIYQMINEGKLPSACKEEGDVTKILESELLPYCVGHMENASS